MNSLPMNSMVMTSETPVYRMKIVLLQTRPPIWRRVLVPADFTLAQLHDVVQVVMGWGTAWDSLTCR